MKKGVNDRRRRRAQASGWSQARAKCATNCLGIIRPQAAESAPRDHKATLSMEQYKGLAIARSDEAVVAQFNHLGPRFIALSTEIRPKRIFGCSAIGRWRTKLVRNPLGTG